MVPEPGQFTRNEIVVFFDHRHKTAPSTPVRGIIRAELILLKLFGHFSMTGAAFGKEFGRIGSLSSMRKNLTD